MKPNSNKSKRVEKTTIQVPERLQLLAQKAKSKFTEHFGNLQTNESTVITSRISNSWQPKTDNQKQHDEEASIAKNIFNSRLDAGSRLNERYDGSNCKSPRSRFGSQGKPLSHLDSRNNSINKNPEFSSVVQQSFYRMNQNGTRTSTIHDLRKKSVDLLKRSLKTATDIQNDKKLDATDYQYSELGSVKGSLYQKKMVQYEFTKQLKVTSDISKLKTVDLLNRLKANGIDFRKLSQKRDTQNDNGFKFSLAVGFSNSYSPDPLCLHSDMSKLEACKNLKSPTNSMESGKLYSSVWNDQQSNHDFNSEKNSYLTLSNNYIMTHNRPDSNKRSTDLCDIIDFVRLIQRFFKSSAFTSIRDQMKANKAHEQSKNDSSMSKNQTIIWGSYNNNTTHNDRIVQASTKPHVKLFSQTKFLHGNVKLTDSLKTVKKNVLEHQSIFRTEVVQELNAFKKQAVGRRVGVTFTEVENIEHK